MTALLEFKQRIKGLYGKYEIYLLPLLKFILALVYFIWINSNMGYMRALDNVFVVLILALICSILPSGMMIFAGFAMMVGHCYALGIDVAGFMLVLILFILSFNLCGTYLQLALSLGARRRDYFFALQGTLVLYTAACWLHHPMAPKVEMPNLEGGQ